MMTVRELIEQLTQFDPETRVVINGYEGGYKDVSGAAGLYLQLNVNTSWYYGPHEKVYDNEEDGEFSISIT